MKVKMATNIFSQTVAANMDSYMRNGKEGLLGATAKGTSIFCRVMDNLFDSVNGHRIKPLKGKLIRCAVKKNSSHFGMWKKFKTILRTCRFINLKGKVVRSSSLVNWGKFLENFPSVCTKLLDEGFNFVIPRRFNQDPLENFFRRVRCHGARNVNPSAIAFNHSFKSLIITNMGGYHSRSYNCEEDTTDGILNELKEFLSAKATVEDRDEIDFDFDDIIDANFSFEAISSSQKQLHNYIAGFVA